MIWHEYELGNSVLKATEDMTLWKSYRGTVEIGRDALAVPIKLGDEQAGYVFHGQGKLLLDTIVETDEGAFGKSIEKQLDKPFLVIGNTNAMNQHLTTANSADVARMGYENEQQFVTAAEGVFDRFFRRGITRHHRLQGRDGFIFAMPNEATDRMDILVAKSNKVVYKAKGVVFVASENNAILKTPAATVISRNGKSFIVKSGCFVCCA